MDEALPGPAERMRNSGVQSSRVPREVSHYLALQDAVVVGRVREEGHCDEQTR